MTTEGEPGIVTPETFSVGELSETIYHFDGTEYIKCGSFAKIGFPLSESFDEIAQELLPEYVSLNPKNLLALMFISKN
jgi:hypothetical protein